MKDKDYFVLTTNVGSLFSKGWFEAAAFLHAGDYGLFQRTQPCCQETIDNEGAITSMLEQQENMRIPTELILIAHRGKPLTMNLRSDNKFVQDEGWNKAANATRDFLGSHQTGRVTYLELGGYNTPGIIKIPF